MGNGWLRWLDNHSTMVCPLTDFDAENCHNRDKNDKADNTTDHNPGNGARRIIPVNKE
jgi:hypothetical protein